MYNYILELKNRFSLLIISWIFSVLVCYLYKETLLFLLIKSNTSLYNLRLFYFISTDLTEIFEVYLKIAYFCSTQLLVFLFLYHIFLFIKPALFKYEYIKLKVVLSLVAGAYGSSVLLFNKFILPIIWMFFFNFQKSTFGGVNVFFESRVKDYVKFYIIMYSNVVVIGQLFAFILIFLVVSPNITSMVLKTRKVFYLIFLLVATLLTPPDVISQLLVAILFVCLYEFFVIFILFKKML